MSELDLDAIAAQLLEVYRSRETLEPLTATYAGITVDDAYLIQRRQAEARLAEGARIRGWKVGLTSPAMREQLGVHEPDFGHLFGDMVYAAEAPIAAGEFIQPRAEPEIALVLGKPLAGPGVTVTDVIDATAYALPAIEIIDSRITAWRIGLVDTVADNASSGGLVLGSTPVPIAGLDLALLGCVLRRNGRIVQTGSGAAVLGNPLAAAVWLANTLTARGAALEAGQVILTGSITAAIPVRAGDAVTATLDRLGSVTAIFD